MSVDVRSVLPAISVPTLVVHASGDNAVRFECGEYMASHIPVKFADRGEYELKGVPDRWQVYAASSAS